MLWLLKNVSMSWLFLAPETPHMKKKLTKIHSMRYQYATNSLFDVLVKCFGLKH